MSSTLVGVVTVIYMATCISLWFEGQRWLSLCFFGYAVANVGMIGVIMAGMKS